MIKVLFHIDELSAGGAEKVLCNLVNNINLDKFEITVHTTYKCDHKKFLKDGIGYKYVFEKKNMLSSYKYRLEAELGIFYRLHLNGDYDIEVAFLECGPTKVMAASTNRKAVKLAWVHCNLEKTMPDIKRFSKRTKKYYRKYDKVICVSMLCEQIFNKYYGTNIDTRIIYNVIDEKEIINKSKRGVEEKLFGENLNIISVGRLTKAKNFDRLLKIHKILLNEGFLYKLIIVGDGEERIKLEQLLKKYNIEKDTCLLGFKENPYPYMKKSDIYVCSSITEGFSTAIIESLVLGIPVIATDCSGMREILGDSEYGLIVDNSDKGLYEGMKKMIVEENYRTNMSRKAIKRAEMFNTKKSISIIENFFDELCGKS